MQAQLLEIDCAASGGVALFRVGAFAIVAFLCQAHLWIHSSTSFVRDTIARMAYPFKCMGIRFGQGKGRRATCTCVVSIR